MKNYVCVKNLCVRKNLRVRKKKIFGKTYAPRRGGEGVPILCFRTSRYCSTIGSWGSGNHSGVIFDADSESGVRIFIGRTVTEIRSPEILPNKFSRPHF